MTILPVRTLGKYGPQIYQSQGESGLCIYNKDMYVALQFFDHPVIIDFLKDSWYGRRYQNELPRRWWFFLSVCCLFDVFIFPLIFLLTLVVGNMVY